MIQRKGYTCRDFMLDYIDLVCRNGARHPTIEQLVEYSGLSHVDVNRFRDEALRRGWLKSSGGQSPRYSIPGLKLSIRNLPKYETEVEA